jgi:hypothetical protein
MGLGDEVHRRFPSPRMNETVGDVSDEPYARFIDGHSVRTDVFKLNKRCFMLQVY